MLVLLGIISTQSYSIVLPILTFSITLKSITTAAYSILSTFSFFPLNDDLKDVTHYKNTMFRIDDLSHIFGFGVTFLYKKKKDNQLRLSS